MSVITRQLERANSAAFIAFGGLTAFCVYFSMYAFRRSYSAGTYVDVAGWTIDFDFKALLVISQILGYALSKVAGIKIISEMPASRRAVWIIGLITVSWIGLLAFAVLPVQIKFLGLFLNGLPLGLIWGLVFAYLEGRRTTEILGAILSASFIVSSGMVKSVGITLMSWGVPEFWMPAATGALFFPLLFLSVFLLSQLPKPNARDVEARTERLPMNAEQRRTFMSKYGLGVITLVLGYICLTIFRDFRDDFAVDIWAAMGREDDAAVLTQSELAVAIITLLAFAALILIKDNMRALMTIHGMILVGGALVGLSAMAFQAGMLDPLPFMIATGTGLYIAYMPFNAMLFERLIATTRQVANAGFLIYIADASGYLGTVGMLLYKNFFVSELDWLNFYIYGAYATSIVCLTCTVIATVYFWRKLGGKRRPPEAPAAPEAPQSRRQRVPAGV